MKEKESIQDINKAIENIYHLLLKKKIMSKKKAEAWCYDLSEINRSIEVIKNKFIPALLENQDQEEKFQDLLWDIREEFRHLQYHIDDGKLTE